MPVIIDTEDPVPMRGDVVSYTSGFERFGTIVNSTDSDVHIQYVRFEVPHGAMLMTVQFVGEDGEPLVINGERIPPVLLHDAPCVYPLDYTLEARGVVGVEILSAHESTDHYISVGAVTE